MEGRTLSHYRMVQRIGAGGMGVVYRAHDERLDRDVALKVLPPGLLSDEAARRRFRKEALALSRLNHPNIETVHDFDTQEGVDFLVMEYIPGETLAQKLAGGPLPEKEVATLGAQIASALEGAHERGVVHRDLKPGNILVTPRGQAKVLDFGLAMLLWPEGEVSQVETMSQTHAAVGTMPYMAPEQLRGEKVDARSDIYAAGAVLFEMATRQRPFPQKTAPTLINAIQHEAPPTPSTINRRISPTLDGIILKALDKDPSRRYQAARELRVDLERLSAPVPTIAAPRPRALPRWWPLVPVAASLVAAAVLAGLNVGGMGDRLLGRGVPGRIDSLAVLPLVNLSRDPEQEYFADGMTEELIADLSKIGALRVISRTSVMRYKGSSKPLAEIVRELNVNAIIEGSVLRSGDRVRITTQLVEGTTDRHLWAESYERDLGNVLALQSEVAQAIAREIKVRVTSQEHARLAATPAVAPGVYEAYLRGRYHWNKRTDEGLAKAIEYFEQVIERDPTFAPAYAGLADSYILREPGAALPRKEAYARARKAAARALEIDDTLSEAHTSMASTMDAGFDWANAEREYRRAIQLNPSYATAHAWYAADLSLRGRHDEAIAEIKRARDLDPLSLSITVGVGQAYMFARQYDQAIESCREALEMDPSFVDARNIIGYAYEGKGMYAEAIAEFKKGIELSGGDPFLIVGLGHVYAVSGRRSEARKVVEELIELAKRRHVSPVGIAEVYAGLGEKNRALAFLEEAYQENDPQLSALAVDPWMDPLRSDPRFVVLLRRVGLPLPG